MHTPGCITPHTNVITYFITTLIIIIYQMQFYSHTCLSCPQDQKESLLRFKELLAQEIKALRPHAVVKLNDDHGIQTWSNSSISNCCTWPKVTCSSTNTVTHLHLDSLVLINCSSPNYGPYYINPDILIPLFNITTLTSLDVSNNSLGGDFPTHHLSNQTSSSLVFLKLDNNMFQCSFPNEFYHLRKLQHLDMSYNDFNGTLSDQLGGLRNLEFLDISLNSMRGEIAGIGFGNLTNLSYLNINDNSFSGPIPTEIGKLTKMRELHMRWNQFSGPMPIGIGNLTQIESLDISYNHLSGPIPTEIGKLTKIRGLYIEYNQFSSLIPTEIGNLTQILDLDLRSNQFSGRFPNSLLKLHNLEFLFLEKNSFNSSIPPSIGHNLSRLSKLYLANNHFIGGFPESLMSVVSLDISANMLSGSHPLALFNSSLKFLYLSYNNLCGTIPNTIGRAVHLHQLQLSNNNFSGFVPQSISKTKIKYLDLSNNNLSGDGGKFPFLSDIELLNLTSNRFSGPLPLSSFGSSIQWVFLGKNEYSGVLNNKLQGRLRCFDIHDNNIYGEIPSTLFNSSYLQVLILRNNSFHGSIPLFNNNDQFLFENLPLTILDLSYNQLTGTIPPDLGNLSDIVNDHLSILDFGIRFEHEESSGFTVDWKSSERSLIQDFASNGYSLLDLSNNQLSGTIPDTIGNLKYLKSLNFSNNCLSGPIPLTFGELQNIEALDLSHNNLSGQIPYTFSKLYQITTLALSNNNLSGRIPDSRQLDTFDGNIEVYANNSGLCGQQIGVPCPGDEQQPADPSNDDNKDDNDEPLHAWEGAVIGFVVACIGTMMMFYASGYFIVPVYDKRRLCSKLSPCIVWN